MTDEFLEWLNQCPYLWLRQEESDDSITYKFYKERQEALENTEAFDKNMSLLSLKSSWNLRLTKSKKLSWTKTILMLVKI
jgi:hypothetical protein